MASDRSLRLDSQHILLPSWLENRSREWGASYINNPLSMKLVHCHDNTRGADNNLISDAKVDIVVVIPLIIFNPLFVTNLFFISNIQTG